MKTFLKKYIILIAFCIALTETIILAYFCSANSFHSVLFMMISYAILLFFPAGIFIVSLKKHHTKNSLSFLEDNEKETQRQTELEHFSNTKLQFYNKTFSHKLKSLLTLLENNDRDSAKKLLGEPVISESFILICSTSPIVNGVLQSKKAECEKQGILFDYTILFPNKTTFSSSTLISLFSNLLDNAIESCIASSSSSPKIQLSIDYKGDFLLIFMRNTKASSLSFDTQKKESTKMDYSSHGFGLSIIEDIVKQHDGFCEWKDKTTYFESRIMLRYLS